MAGETGSGIFNDTPKISLLINDFPPQRNLHYLWNVLHKLQVNRNRGRDMGTIESDQHAKADMLMAALMVFRSFLS